MLAERAKIACYKTERKKDPLSYWARSQRLYDNEQSTTPRRLGCIGCRVQAPKWAISKGRLLPCKSWRTGALCRSRFHSNDVGTRLKFLFPMGALGVDRIPRRHEGAHPPHRATRQLSSGSVAWHRTGVFTLQRVSLLAEVLQTRSVARRLLPAGCGRGGPVGHNDPDAGQRQHPGEVGLIGLTP